MGLIIQCIYATESNGKLPIVKECLASLGKTVNLKKHRWIIVNNSCWEETERWLDWFMANIKGNITLIHLPENIGTARGINIGLRTREPGEVCVKTDDDLTWGSKGWVDELEEHCKGEVGILGLKRSDVYGEFIEDGKLLWCDDIMGTCTAYNPLMLDKVGAMIQISNFYGFDDSIFSVRSRAAGFRNAFLPHIKITNLDKGGTAYTQWKKDEAGRYIVEATEYMKLILSGDLSYYDDGDI